MTDPSSPHPPPPVRRGHRGCLIVLVLLLVPLVVLASLYARSTIAATHELEEAIAETDRLDPHWRLSDVEADRAVIPERENSALVVLAIKPLLPAKWPFWFHPLPAEDPKGEAKRAALERSFTNLEDPRQLNGEQIEGLRVLVWSLLPLTGKLSAACQPSRMELRCAIAAVAAERYRREKKHWPDKLEALRESGHLKEAPVDLYDGQPLRMRRLEDGVVIYSVGPDGRDDGGHIDPANRFAKGTDIVFRLWDVAKRRHPVAAPGM